MCLCRLSICSLYVAIVLCYEVVVMFVCVCCLVVVVVTVVSHILPSFFFVRETLNGDGVADAPKQNGKKKKERN